MSEEFENPLSEEFENHLNAEFENGSRDHVFDSALNSTNLIAELLARTRTEIGALETLLEAGASAGANALTLAQKRVARKRQASHTFRDNARYRTNPMPRARNQSFALTHNGVEIRALLIAQSYDEQGCWRQRTALHCRYDGQAFDGIPVAIPLAYSIATRAYKVYGTFCGFPCARAFLAQQLSQTAISEAQFYERLALLEEVAREHFGVYRFYSAPALEALAIFGGDQSLSEWRAQGGVKSHTILCEPPIEPFDQLVLERIEDYEERKAVQEHYYGRNDEERRAKETERQERMEKDMTQASLRHTKRVREQIRNPRNNLFTSLGITLVEK